MVLTDANTAHQPVLLAEVIEKLNINSNGIFIDCTFGRGGHSREILKSLSTEGRLLVLDRDAEAIAYANEYFANDARLLIEQKNFSQILTAANKYNFVGKVNGILLDLGVSSPQLDDPTRGFSFKREGPLDMRMDADAGQSAATWLQQVEAKELVRVLKEYGQERFAKKIANAIIQQREVAPLETTKQLAELVQKTIGRTNEKKHPATRTFQAIRIFINKELEELATALDDCFELLAASGRLLVITFHSLEDQIVKNFIRKYNQSDLPRKLPVMEEFTPKLKKVCKAIKSSEHEVDKNPRARSAKLYVLERVAC